MRDAQFSAGDTAVVECMADGSPQPSITWLKDDRPLVTTERHFFTAENQLLVIVEATPDDSGVYTCRMSNPLGVQADSMTLDVRAPAAGARSRLFNSPATTTGIIVIAVVGCVVGTSLIWVVIIYQMRRKNEEYSPTPTEETNVPEVAILDKKGNAALQRNNNNSPPRESRVRSQLSQLSQS